MSPYLSLALACLAGGVVSLVVRALWYHPKAFGASNEGGNASATFIASFIVCAYLSYEMKWVNHPDDLNFFVHGMYHGARNIGVFAAGAIIVHALAEGKSAKHIATHAAYWLLTFALIGGVLASFPSFRPPKTDGETSMKQVQPYEAPSPQEAVFQLT